MALGEPVEDGAPAGEPRLRPGAKLYSVDPDGTDLHVEPIPDVAGCDRPHIRLARPMPGGRVAYVYWCFDRFGQRNNRDRVTLRVYDPPSGATELLGVHPLRDDLQAFDLAPAA